MIVSCSIYLLIFKLLNLLLFNGKDTKAEGEGALPIKTGLWKYP